MRKAIHEHIAELEEGFWADDVIDEWEQAGKPSRPAGELWDELGV